MPKILVFLLMCGICFGPALAQQQDNAASTSAPAQPEFTAAGFGDWLLRCAQLEGRPRSCEILHSVSNQGQVVAQIAIGRVAAGQPLSLTLVVTPNITITTVPKMILPGGTGRAQSSVDLNWRHCSPGLCLADVALTDATLTHMRRLTENGRMEFLTSDGRQAQMAISLRGISAALDALGREAAR